MAISNYNDLLVAAANWLARDDLNARIPEFVALFEAAANRELRVRDMEQRAYCTTVDGQRLYAWPTDMVELRYIKIDGTPPTVLQYLNPEQFESQDPQVGGTPRYWSDIQAALCLWPTPTEGLTVQIDYYRRLDLANAGESGNWLIRRHPDIYLYGTLMQAEPYLMNDARVETWRSLLNAAADQLRNAEWRIKAGAMPAMVRADYRGA
jgi:hypothetical protein